MAAPGIASGKKKEASERKKVSSVKQKEASVKKKEASGKKKEGSVKQKKASVQKKKTTIKSKEDDNEVEIISPQPYDAGPRESVYGIPTPDDLALWTMSAAQFIRSQAGINDGDLAWVGKRPLGQGGFGLAGLWEKIDSEGNVVDVRACSLVGDDCS